MIEDEWLVKEKKKKEMEKISCNSPELVPKKKSYDLEMCTTSDTKNRFIVKISDKSNANDTKPSIDNNRKCDLLNASFISNILIFYNIYKSYIKSFLTHTTQQLRYHVLPLQSWCQ